MSFWTSVPIFLALLWLASEHFFQPKTQQRDNWTYNSCFFQWLYSKPQKQKLALLKKESKKRSCINAFSHTRQHVFGLFGKMSCFFELIPQLFFISIHTLHRKMYFQDVQLQMVNKVLDISSEKSNSVMQIRKAWHRSRWISYKKIKKKWFPVASKLVITKGPVTTHCTSCVNMRPEGYKMESNKNNNNNNNNTVTTRIMGQFLKQKAPRHRTDKRHCHQSIIISAWDTKRQLEVMFE